MQDTFQRICPFSGRLRLKFTQPMYYIPGAVDHPTRVTCRYLRGTGERLPFPPPLMERESLASRVIEMGPLTANFKVPVLLEVPHFAGVRGGERELIVLRCDDGKLKNTYKGYSLSELRITYSWINSPKT